MKELLNSLITEQNGIKVINFSDIEKYIPTINVLLKVLKNKDSGKLTKYLEKIKIKVDKDEELYTVHETFKKYKDDKTVLTHSPWMMVNYGSRAEYVILKQVSGLEILEVICQYHFLNKHITQELAVVKSNTSTSEKNKVQIKLVKDVTETDVVIPMNSVTVKILYTTFENILQVYYGTRKIKKIFNKLIKIFNITSTRVTHISNIGTSNSLLIKHDAVGSAVEDFTLIELSGFQIPGHQNSKDVIIDVLQEAIRFKEDHIMCTSLVNREMYLDIDMKTLKLKIQ